MVSKSFVLDFCFYALKKCKSFYNRPNKTTLATVYLKFMAEKECRVYPAYLLTGTTGIARLTKTWKRKSFPSLMLLDILLSVNNWNILTLKVSYEFLVVIMAWRPDLFSILMCSASSSLKVNAVHHWPHKALLEELRAAFARVFLLLAGLKAPSEFSLWCWSQLTISTAGKKKCMLFTYCSRDRHQKVQRAASCVDQSSVCSSWGTGNQV